jgi:hypothetical protein
MQKRIFKYIGTNNDLIVGKNYTEYPDFIEEESGFVCICAEDGTMRYILKEYLEDVTDVLRADKQLNIAYKVINLLLSVFGLIALYQLLFTEITSIAFFVIIAAVFKIIIIELINNNNN